MAQNSRFWLVKSEPASYSWSDLVRDAQTSWTGVRNFQARNSLRAMKKGERVLFYHSVTDPSVVGIAAVVKEAYPDPTAEEGEWSCVDLAPVKALPAAVPLSKIKEDNALAGIALIKQSRLSVMPVTAREYGRILQLGGTA